MTFMLTAVEWLILLSQSVSQGALSDAQTLEIIVLHPFRFPVTLMMAASPTLSHIERLLI